VRKFQFPLQAALGLRERAVELAESALRAIQAELNENRRRQETLMEEIKSAESAVRSDHGPVDPGDLMALDRYRGAAQRQQARMEQEKAAIARRLAERQGALQLAERDRTLLVRLKEKSLARWRVEFDKEQQQLAEEAYLSRWGR
jgi:flagellar export protein FliJ